MWSLCAPIATNWPLRAGSEPGRIATTLRPGARSSFNAIVPERLFPTAPALSESVAPNSRVAMRGVTRIDVGATFGVSSSRSAVLRSTCGRTAAGMRSRLVTRTAAEWISTRRQREQHDLAGHGFSGGPGGRVAGDAAVDHGQTVERDGPAGAR